MFRAACVETIKKLFVTDQTESVSGKYAKILTIESEPELLRILDGHAILSYLRSISRGASVNFSVRDKIGHNLC